MSTKKELKRLYKETALPMGIYCLANKATGKRFIASSKNLNAAKNSIYFQLRGGLYPLEFLQSDWKTFGECNFEFSVLETLKADADKDIDKELKALLHLVIDENNLTDGYNF